MRRAGTLVWVGGRVVCTGVQRICRCSTGGKVNCPVGTCKEPRRRVLEERGRGTVSGTVMLGNKTISYTFLCVRRFTHYPIKNGFTRCCVIVAVYVQRSWNCHDYVK